MNLPEQERYSIEDAAARLKTSVSYVKDMIRRGLLPTQQGPATWDTIPTGLGRVKHKITLNYSITRQSLEQFEQTYGGTPGQWKHLKEGAGLLDMSERTLKRRFKEEDKKVEKGTLKEEDRQFKYTTDGKRILVFVPAKYLSK